MHVSCVMNQRNWFRVSRKLLYRSQPPSLSDLMSVAYSMAPPFFSMTSTINHFPLYNQNKGQLIITSQIVNLKRPNSQSIWLNSMITRTNSQPTVSILYYGYINGGRVEKTVLSVYFCHHHSTNCTLVLSSPCLLYIRVLQFPWRPTYCTLL